MTEQQISQSLDELILLVSQGKPMEAFDKYYHDEIEKTDLDGVTHLGKVLNTQIGNEALIECKRDPRF